MISRRQLRIKVLQTLYAYYKAEKESLQLSEKELHFNIEKAFELYHYLLLLILDIALYTESRIELARNKRIPTHEDLNPNTRFIDNKLIEQIRNNDSLNRYIEKKKLNWANYPELIKELYKNISASEIYSGYMTQDEVSYNNDKRVISRIYSDIIFPNDSLSQILEEQSIYWNDDLEFIISMIIKSFKKFKEGDGPEKELMQLYKNSDDRDFAINLFRKSVINRNEYLEYIKSNTKNWDLERIAFMDILIMQMAIAEMLNFSSIPTKVTLNEYLDIAKFYSTEKSNIFINGVLDKIVEQLRNEKKLIKTGRGLIGEYE